MNTNAMNPSERKLSFMKSICELVWTQAGRLGDTKLQSGRVLVLCAWLGVLRDSAPDSTSSLSSSSMRGLGRCLPVHLNLCGVLAFRKHVASVPNTSKNDVVQLSSAIVFQCCTSDIKPWTKASGSIGEPPPWPIICNISSTNSPFSANATSPIFLRCMQNFSLLRILLLPHMICSILSTSSFRLLSPCRWFSPFAAALRASRKNQGIHSIAISFGRSSHFSPGTPAMETMSSASESVTFKPYLDMSSNFTSSESTLPSCLGNGMAVWCSAETYLSSDRSASTPTGRSNRNGSSLCSTFMLSVSAPLPSSPSWISSRGHDGRCFCPRSPPPGAAEACCTLPSARDLPLPARSQQSIVHLSPSIT
mmetsp:Transcript_7220/g.45037  ORF Transcript_7220/g.45037 Transcript_7220/m.45037 type:complete len:364 (+) Transcript_7220:2978-4069(+)